MDAFFDGWILPFFDRAESIPCMTPQDIAVYMALLTIAKKAGGESKEFSCAIKTIESKSHVKRTSVYASVNRLKQFGLLESKQSGGRNAAKYRLCSPRGRYYEHDSEHDSEHKTGLLDDNDEDDRYTARVREAFRHWRDAFGEFPAGATAMEIEAWAARWDGELLREAFNAAALAGASNRFGYVNAVLADWAATGIRTIEQWARMQVAFDGVLEKSRRVSK